MAFPATFNINYYKGDTYEFRVYPKDAAGTVFNLNGYQAAFTISNERGPAGIPNQINAYAEISPDNTYIQCAILPGNAEFLAANTSYVYDIEVRRDTLPYDLVYTVLTGNVVVTEQVTGAI